MALAFLYVCYQRLQLALGTLRRLDLNLPISFIGSLSVVHFLDLPTPPGNYRDKFGRMDWMWVRS